MLDHQEQTRYARQIILNHWGLAAQEKLKNTTVFVAGAGGSGSPIITQLALLGVGNIRICDFDTVDLSNLNRQFLHCVGPDSRLGVNKALSAQKTVANINPNIKVEVFTEKITEENIDAMVGDAEILFDSVDKIDVKFILSKAAMRKNIPHLFYGMMDINAFVCVFYPPKTPCFHCLYDYTKVREVIGDYTGVKKASTPVCCPPVFLSAGFAVNEAVKILLGNGIVAYNKFMFFLQTGSDEVGEIDGYLGMRYWMSDFFFDLAIEQGFDADIGWRGNYLEELTIKADPNCPHCSKLNVSKNPKNGLNVEFNF